MNPARRTTPAATTATAVVLATAGALLGTAAPAASAATTCNSPVYKRQFFANTALSGAPKRTDCDSAIAENWGAKAPATGLPKDNFGIRWTVTRDFGSGGPFALTVAAQDGIRVYLDGKIKVNVWKNVTTTQKKTVNLTIPSGNHTLRVDYANFTGNANVNFVYTPRTSASVDKVKPLAPTSTSVTYDSATSKAKVTWVKNKEMDLAGYRVYQRTDGSSNWRRISGNSPLTGTSFTDSLLPSGTAYYYEVRAVDKAGNESAGSADQLVTTADRTPPKVSVPTAANDHLFGVSLGWDTEGALTYDVFRAASPTGDFEKIGTSATNGAMDATAPYGDTSYYRITAKDAAGNSAQSPVLAFTRPLAVPYMESADTNEAETGVEVRWTVSKTAPTQFRLYRWERFDENAVPEQVACEPYRVGNAADYFPQYGCTDYSAVTGTDYWYHVTSVDSAGRESDPSRVNSGTRTDTTSPPAVTGLTAATTEYGTVLKWDESTASDLASYGIWRGTSVTNTFTHELVARVEPGTTQFVDTDLPDGQNWVYFVDAMDTFHNSLYTYASYPTDVSHVLITELDLTPAVTPERTAAWTLSSAADDSGSPALSWTCSSGCANAGFHVSRWDRATGQYVRLTEQPLTADATGYTDLAAPAATTNHYVVSVLGEDGSEAISNVVYTVIPPNGA